jgi:hypothetical protein
MHVLPLARARSALAPPRAWPSALGWPSRIVTLKPAHVLLRRSGRSAGHVTVAMGRKAEFSPVCWIQMNPFSMYRFNSILFQTSKIHINSNIYPKIIKPVLFSPFLTALSTKIQILNFVHAWRVGSAVAEGYPQVKEVVLEELGGPQTSHATDTNFTLEQGRPSACRSYFIYRVLYHFMFVMYCALTYRNCKEM